MVGSLALATIVIAGTATLAFGLVYVALGRFIEDTGAGL